MNNDLDPWLQMIPQSTLEKALNPSAEALGKGAGGIISALMFYPRKLGIYTEYQLLNYQNELASKVNKIPTENRDSSKKGLAIKSLEDSAYQLESDELRNMFTNLIASTLDNRKNESVHPFFSSILKDMDVSDAKLFEFIYQESRVATVSVRATKKDNNSYQYLTDLDLLLGNREIAENENASIDLLSNFGLIIVDRDLSLAEENYESRYNDYETSPHRNLVENNFFESIEDDKQFTIDVKRGFISITDLGRLFGSTVINDQ